MTKRDQGKVIDLNDIWQNLRHSAEWKGKQHGLLRHPTYRTYGLSVALP